MDPTACIALVDDANDLPVLYYFRKGSRPCAAVGWLPFLLAGCAASIDLSRLFLVVIAVSKSALCPSYVFLDFLVIQFRRFILTYEVGGQLFEDAECFLSFQRTCLIRWCPLELLVPGAHQKTGLGAPLRLKELVSHSYAEGRLGLIFLVYWS